MQVKFDFSTFEADCVNELRKIVRLKLAAFQEKCLLGVQPIVAEAIRVSPEYISLSSGLLRTEFGLGKSVGGQVEGQEAAESVVEAVVNNIKVLSKVNNTSLEVGRFSLNILRKDLTDAFLAKWASYVSVSKLGSHSIDWLRWLLMEGDRIIIGNAEIRYDLSNKGSRTKSAIMLSNLKKNKKPSSGANFTWRVPPEFAGVQSSNWLTKAIASASPIIQTYLQSEVSKFV